MKCGKAVPSGVPTLHSGVFLTKNCPECGITMALIESDAAFFEAQETLPREYSQNDCYMIDVTGQCSAGCRSCYSRGGEHRKISDVVGEICELPRYSRVLLSGGEPLEHPEIDSIVYAAYQKGHQPVLLTNGAGLTLDCYRNLIRSGLTFSDAPQIAVSLGLPGTNNTFKLAYDNLKQIKVADVAFTVETLDEIDTVQAIAATLRGHSESICIRTAWDGNTSGLFISDIVKRLDGTMIPSPTLHGYRNAMVEKDGIIYKVLSWPTWEQYDLERYHDRGVWYKGKNVVTEILSHVAPFPM
jgi:uncharacterized radical SAM superfamily Fe-S cluster-containing enzyme